MNLWSMLTHMNKEDICKKLAEDITVAVPSLSITVLSRDQSTGCFMMSWGDVRRHLPGADFLDSSDPVLTRLLAGEPWVPWIPGRSSLLNADEQRAAAEVIFPVAVHGMIDHVLVVSNSGLSYSDKHLIGGYCRQTALALETIDMQASLKRKLEHLASLVGNVDDLHAVASYRKLLQSVLERSAELLLAEQGSLMLFEKETDELLLEASRGVFNNRSETVRVARGVGIAGKVAEQGEPMLVGDIERDPRFGKKTEAHYKTPSFVSVPIKIRNRVVGVMNFTDKSTGDVFDEVDLRFAQTCASHAAVVLDHKEMCEQTEQLKTQATTDNLTGLLNRGCILSRLQEELVRSDRYEKTMSLVMLDVDGFKAINDHLGHSTGDRILRSVSKVMSNALRSIDIIGRYGGDEFVIILPETDAFFAADVAERIRSDVATTDISQECPECRVGRVTVSMGIATFPVHGTSPDVLVDHADEALYRAKAEGRNRVVVY